MTRSLLLDVRDLCIHRDSVHILKDVNWSVRKGEHWVILGANGSGKTSLLKSLTGYMPPSDGDISVLGETFGESDWRELRKRIGVVSASISQLVHDEDSALEIVIGGKQAMIGVWGRVAPVDQSRALRLLSLMRIRSLASRRWEVLSQGERQRVLIARALMGHPPILILDEPCSGLDPVARERFLEDIRSLASRKNAPCLVFVTHHIEEILPEFTHLLALKNGRIAYSGPLRAGMTPETLDTIFLARLAIEHIADRYHLRTIDRAK